MAAQVLGTVDFQAADAARWRALRAVVEADGDVNCIVNPSKEYGVEIGAYYMDDTKDRWANGKTVDEAADKLIALLGEK
jgi:hypothetical protein